MDSSQSFFIKCSECKLKPATLKCHDCKKNYGENSNKFCYSCDTKLHQSQKDKNHKKDIIPYNEMYNQERSITNISINTNIHSNRLQLQMPSKGYLSPKQQSSIPPEQQVQKSARLIYNQNNSGYNAINTEQSEFSNIPQRDFQNLFPIEQTNYNLSSKKSSYQLNSLSDTNSTKYQLQKQQEKLDQKKKDLMNKIEQLNSKLSPFKNPSSSSYQQEVPKQPFSNYEQHKVSSYYHNQQSLDLSNQKRQTSTSNIYPERQEQFDQQQTSQIIPQSKLYTQTSQDQLNQTDSSQTDNLKSNLKKPFDNNSSTPQWKKDLIRQKLNLNEENHPKQQQQSQSYNQYLPKQYQQQQKSPNINNADISNQSIEDVGLSEFKYKLRIQELEANLLTLQSQLDSSKKQNELDLKKHNQDILQCQEQALTQIDKLNKQFKEERNLFTAEKTQLNDEIQKLFEERKQTNSDNSDLQSLLEQEIQKSEEIMNEYIQLEDNVNKEKQEMELTINEIKQVYEEKLDQLESLLQLQSDKIIEMQKCYQEDPLLKMLNENPDILNIIEQIQQKQVQNKSAGTPKKQSKQQPKSNSNFNSLAEIDSQQQQQQQNQKLNPSQQYSSGNSMQGIQESNILKDQYITELQENYNIQELEIQKMNELITNFKQLQAKEQEEKQQIQEQLNQNLQQLQQKDEEIKLKDSELEQLVALLNNSNHELEQFKEFFKQNMDNFNFDNQEDNDDEAETSHENRDQEDDQDEDNQPQREDQEIQDENQENHNEAQEDDEEEQGQEVDDDFQQNYNLRKQNLQQNQQQNQYNQQQRQQQ